MNILINRLSNQVEGINTPSTPFNYSVEVNDDFNITKTVEVQEGEIQKINEEGQPLFLKEIYRTETTQILWGRDEVLEDTGVPVMIKAQKENIEGHKLYLEPLYEDGEIVDYAEVVHAFDEDGTPNEPVIVEVHKKSIGGRLLYYKDLYTEDSKEVLDHTEETTEVTDVPVMIPNMVEKVVTLKDNCELFDFMEVLQAKYQHILEESQKDYILGDMFIDENDLDLEDEKHSANTGLALLELLPKGQAKTKTITLAEPTTEFILLDFVSDEGVEVYLSGKKFTEGKLTLTSPISNCTIKFVNTTDSKKTVKSYAIGY